MNALAEPTQPELEVEPPAPVPPPEEIWNDPVERLKRHILDLAFRSMQREDLCGTTLRRAVTEDGTLVIELEPNTAPLWNRDARCPIFFQADFGVTYLPANRMEEPAQLYFVSFYPGQFRRFCLDAIKEAEDLYVRLPR